MATEKQTYTTEDDQMAAEASALALEETETDVDETEQLVDENVPIENTAMKLDDAQQGSLSKAGMLKQSVVEALGMGPDGEGIDMDKIAMSTIQTVVSGALVSKITGNKALGVAAGLAGTFVLRKMELLPDSFQGIQEYVKNITDHFDGTKAKEEQAAGEQAFVNEQIGQKLDGIDQSMRTDIASVAQGLGTDSSVSIKENMATSGADMAASDVFLVTGQMDETGLQALGMMSQGTMDVFAENVNHLADESGQLNDEMKADVIQECKTLQDGFKSYSDAAMTKFEEIYVDDPEKLEIAKCGLSRVMQQEAGPFYQTIQALDSKYGFLSKDDKAYFTGIEGVSDYGTVLSDETQQQSEPEQQSVQTSQTQMTGKSYRPLPTVTESISNGPELSMGD